MLRDGVWKAVKCLSHRYHQPGRAGWTGTASGMTSELYCQPVPGLWDLV